VDKAVAARSAYEAVMMFDKRSGQRHVQMVRFLNCDALTTSVFVSVFESLHGTVTVAASSDSDLKKADSDEKAESHDIQHLSNASQKQKTSQSNVEADQQWWNAATDGHQLTMDHNALQSVLPTSSANSTTVNRCETVIPKSSDPYRIVTPSGIAVQIYQGNLLDEKVDAIVNPANTELTHGGGAARAIAEAAGRQLQEECRAYISEHKELKVTQVMHTTAGNLNPPVIYVIHVAGPLAAQFHNSDSLYQAVFDTFKHCMLYANNFLCVSSLSIPAISSGEYIAVF